MLQLEIPQLLIDLELEFTDFPFFSSFLIPIGVLKVKPNLRFLLTKHLSLNSHCQEFIFFERGMGYKGQLGIGHFNDEEVVMGVRVHNFLSKIGFESVEAHVGGDFP